MNFERRDVFMRLADQTGDGVVVLDADGRVVYINQIAQTLLNEHAAVTVGQVPDGVAFEENAATIEGDRPHPIPHVEVKTADISWYDAPARLVTLRDHTAEHEALAAYRMVTDLSLQAMVLIRDGRFIYVNDEACRIIGRDREAMLSLGVGEMDQIVHPDDRSQVMARIAQRASGVESTPNRYSFRIVRPDGATRWVDVVSHRIELAGQHTIQTTFVDSTEREEVSRTAAERSRRLEALFDLSPNPIMLVDQQGRFVDVNPAAEVFFENNKRQLIGRYLGEFSAPNVTRRPHEPFVAPSTAEIEFGINGQRKFLVVNVTPIVSDAQRRLLFGVGIDVTERHIAETQLRHRLNLEHMVADAASQFVSVPDTRIIPEIESVLARLVSFTNAERAFVGYLDEGNDELTLLEWRDDEVADRPLEPSFRAAWPKIDWLRQRLRRGEYLKLDDCDQLPPEAAAEIELCHTVNAGSIVIVPMFFARRLRGFLGLGGPTMTLDWPTEDIAILSTLATVFCNALARRWQRLERERLEAQLAQSQKLEAIGRLAGGVAHDFNNVLTVIQGIADLSLHNLPADHPDLRRDLTEIGKATRSGASLAQRLLAFSRQQVVERRAIDLNDTIAASHEMLRRALGEDIVYEFEPDADLWPIEADGGQIDQILLNLTVNARDAMPEGGRLTVTTKNCADARPVPGAAGDFVCLTVTDNGQGIDPTIMGNIFEPFFSTKPKEKGSGLGLATVYGTIKQHGGYIAVDSTLGAGARFRIYFPRHSGPVERAKPREKAVDGRGAETVLVAEDQDAVRDLSERILSMYGYRVLTAADGPTAIQLYEKTAAPIDLLLTDVVMPGMSGRQLYESLVERQPGLKVVYMSGYTENAIGHHGVLAPGIHFIQKPFTLTSLVRMVRDVLDGVPSATS